MLRAAAYKDTKKCPSKLPSVLAAYRMTVHSTTGLTPNRAMLGREVLLPASLIVAPPEENMPQSGFVQDFQENLRQVRQQVRQAMGSFSRSREDLLRPKSEAVFVPRRPKGLALLAKILGTAEASQAHTSLDRTLDPRSGHRSLLS